MKSLWRKGKFARVKDTKPAVASYSLADIAQLPVDKVYGVVSSRPLGLTTEEAEKRLAKYCKNSLSVGKRSPLIYKFLANFVHLMALLLWAAGFLAFIAQMPQ